MSKTRICFVIPSLHPGGMERVMSEILDDFSRRDNLELHLVLYGIKREVFYPVPKSVTLHRPDWKFNNDRRLLSTVRTMLFLRKCIRSIQPDRILSFGEFWNSFVLLTLLGTRFPVYVSDRCQPDKNLGRLHERLRAALYPRAAGIVAQTAYAARIYGHNKLNRNIKVIGNPIRPILPDSEIQKENWILSVGRLISSKHHDELIRLFSKTTNTGWKLVIVGGDANKEKNMGRLENLVEELGVHDQVILAGNRDDVDDYYRRSRVFAFTSSSEGFPNVLGEAQSAGLAVVTFDCVAGPSDMVEDGENGFLVPLFDYEKFQDRLQHLIDNENLREQLGEKARQSIMRFSKSSVCEQFYLLLTSTDTV